jgi:hypothetical protein
VNGNLEAQAQVIAFYLLTGSQAEIVEQSVRNGAALRFMEVDGNPVPLPAAKSETRAALRVTHPDRSVSLYVGGTSEAADTLLERAHTIADDMRAQLPPVRS